MNFVKLFLLRAHFHSLKKKKSSSKQTVLLGHGVQQNDGCPGEQHEDFSERVSDAVPFTQAVCENQLERPTINN